MKRIIFSLYRDDLDPHTSVNTEKRIAFKKYEKQLNKVKKDYAEFIRADYKLFTPDTTHYDQINFQKILMFKDLAEEYDEILYLDYDVIPTKRLSFFSNFNLRNICAFNVNCQLDREIIMWRNRDANWHNMDMYSKAQNKLAMLILNDEMGTNTCINTGVLGMNREMVQELDFNGRYRDTKGVWKNSLMDNLYPEEMTKSWQWNNEVALSYLIEKYNLPFTDIGQPWNFIVDDNIPNTSGAAYFLHFVHKRFEMYFNQG